MDLRRLKPMFRWPLSPRRPRCPSSISSSSSSALNSRVPSFSSDEQEYSATAQDWPHNLNQECSCDCHAILHTEAPLSFQHLKSFTFNDLKRITGNFQPGRVIVPSALGRIYKGWINEQTFTASMPGLGLVVAVKKLSPENLEGQKEWLTEIDYLGQINHPNIVKLIGYCSEADERYLVYEYMPRGSLENHLFRGGLAVSWAIRIEVAIGVAEGLSFLHDAESQVIHRDVKSSHILLDSEFNAKLTGFGIARAGPTGVSTHVSTRVMGTYGYAAPEYIATGHLSAKADVYSFGVVLLELFSGRRAVDMARSYSNHNLVDWAKPYLGDKRKLYRIMDPTMKGQCYRKAAHSFSMLALRCLSNDPKLRPCMSEVLASLEQIQDMKE